MIKEEEIIRIGKFHKTHGLKGELNVILDIEPDYFIEGNPLIVELDGLYVPFYIETIRQKGTISYLMKLEGVDSENLASAFVNKEINILKEGSEEWIDAEEEDENSFKGFTVMDSATDKCIGIIEDIDDSTDNILFLVKNEEKTFYIPAVDEFITDIDETVRILKVNLPEGLLDINNKD